VFLSLSRICSDSFVRIILIVSQADRYRRKTLLSLSRLALVAHVINLPGRDVERAQDSKGTSKEEAKRTPLVAGPGK